MNILLVKTLSGFKPAYDSDYELSKKIKVGDQVKAKITRPRNLGHHKKFFALLNLGFHNQDIADNFEDFREAVTIAAGFYHDQKQIDGSFMKRANSISFANMNQKDFEDVYSKVFDVVLKVVGCKSEEIETELINFL